MPDGEVKVLSSYLFGGSEGIVMAERIDPRVDRLPGLAGLDLTHGVVRRGLIQSRGSKQTIKSATA